ncbi:formate C-acetyltransferase/glycerol dehydratase family glycyl radical enzyme [Eubacteriales bacterium DFI.9.88]|nr:formate C-acetyltransferase/glycerol dehydratase family glycyl radical enzyme [Eubacteriales bacterium DFI.9.88]
MVNVKHVKWADGCTDRINRLRDKYWNHTPEIDLERALVYTDVYRQNEAMETCVKRAKAMYKYIEAKTITIDEDELIVGTDGNKHRAAQVNPDMCWRWYNDELETMASRQQDPYYISEENKKIFKEQIVPYWEGKSMEDYFLENCPEDLKRVGLGTMIIFGDLKATGGAGEMAVGYGNIIMKKGFKGVEEEAKANMEKLDLSDPTAYDKMKFYESVLICCQAAKLLGERHAEKARQLASETSDKKRAQELLEIAKICDRVPYHAPQTFREAVQSVWLTQILLWAEENTNSYCIDRPDQFLYPFYKHDIENGILTKGEAQELIECLWIKIAEMIFVISADSAEFYAGYMAFNGLTIGGMDEEGNDAANELSEMMLKATADLRMHAPTVNVRVCDETSDDFLMKVIDLVKLGTGQPAIFFDNTAIELLKRRGVPEKIARNWCVGGCVEPNVPGVTNIWGEGCKYAYPAAVEWALFNGYSRILDKDLGMHTGDPRDFKTFEEFEAAVKKQLAFLIECSVRFAQLSEKIHQRYAPKPARSIVLEGCVERGVDSTFGGAYFNGGPGLEPTGVADVADSLMAVKKLVYDDKVITMDQLIKALEANFEGPENEIIRKQLINNAPKYGNDVDEVDQFARDIVEFSCTEANRYRGVMGTKFENGVVPVSANIPQGKVICALPSGRKAGESLSDGLSPYPGYDTHGPTAVLKSICKVDHTSNGVGTLLNMKLNPDLLQTEADKRKLMSLLRAESDLLGYHIQFNVVSSEVLKKAKADPESYSDLLVRVAGYSAFFVELAPDAQDAIINRTENTMW